MAAFFQLSALSASEFARHASGRGGAADEDEDDAEPAPAAQGGGGGGPSGGPPPSVITIAGGAVVAATTEAVVGALRELLWRAPGAGAAAAPAAGAPELAAVGTLRQALLANAAFMREALRRPFLPDVPHARPAHFPVLGVDEGVVGGVRVRLTLARAAPVVREGALPAVAAAALRCADVRALRAAPPSLLLQGGERVQTAPGAHFFTALDEALASDAGAAACPELAAWLSAWGAK